MTFFSNSLQGNQKYFCFSAGDLQSVIIFPLDFEQNAQTNRYSQDSHYRFGSDRHRAGLRVRLFGDAGLPRVKQEGFEVVLVNSNPATIMTDPEIADRTYIEPLTLETRHRDHRKGTPGRAAADSWRADRVEFVGRALREGNTRQVRRQTYRREHRRDQGRRRPRAVQRGDGRDRHPSPKGGFAHTWEEAEAIVEETGYPAIIRPAFTLGGTGGGTAYNPEEFEEIAKNGLAASPVSQILVEESILGWKEYELEVMRDLNDNVVIICSIENFDPMGVHTGDSITVAPAQTLTESNISGCATCRSAASARSAWKRAARISSSPSIPKTATSASSR